MNVPFVSAFFADSADAAINSMVLRSIFMHTRESCIVPGHEDLEPCFPEILSSWGVRIEDQHSNTEDAPHYVLEVGAGLYRELCVVAVFAVQYCDYHSVLESEGAEKNDIVRSPGQYTITVWLPNKYKEMLEKFAGIVNGAYYEAMEKALPAYAILVSEMYRVDKI